MRRVIEGVLFALTCWISTLIVLNEAWPIEGTAGYLAVAGSGAGWLLVGMRLTRLE